MVEAFICQVKMFFKKTIIKNHDFFVLVVAMLSLLQLESLRFESSNA